MRLIELVSRDTAWMWCVASHGDADLLVTGSVAGSIDCVKLDFEVVNSLYRDRYAYRENLTDVIVHHLVTDKKVRIKCKDLIRNLALYGNKLAVQLSDRICVYECSADDTADMHFRLRKEKVYVNLGNLGSAHNLLEITSSHLLVVVGCMVELYGFDGQRHKVWLLESPALCARVDGGLPGRDGVLLGCANGAVMKLFIDNAFPIQISKQATAVTQLDINIYRNMLATVDTNHMMNVIDLSTQEVLFSLPNIMLVCFNTEVEDLVCVTGMDLAISVLSGICSLGSGASERGASAAGKSTMLPEVQEQHLNGRSLGFRGQKIFCLSRAGVSAVDVPQGANIQRALDNNDIPTAYKIACLGATEADWKLLAMRSLRANHLQIAKNAFARLKDSKFLSLIDTIERTGSGAGSVAGALSIAKPSIDAGRSSNAPSVARLRGADVGGASKSSTTAAVSSGMRRVALAPLESSWLAELLAYEGHFQEAAKVYARSGKVDEAIRLLTDLRRYEDAKMFARNAGQTDISNLTLQQARWLEEINDWKGSAELFMSLGQQLNAARIIVESKARGWEEALIEVVRACPADGSTSDTLSFCGDNFSSLEDIAYAREAYTKAKEISRLMALYAKRHMWNEAATLADENEGKFDVSIFLSYAEWLISRDRYEEAIKAYKKAKRMDLARKVLEELTDNAVSECRFKDAAYYYWMLSKETETEVAASLGTRSDVATTVDASETVSAQQSVSNDFKTKLLLPEHAAALQYEYVHKADLYYAYAHVHAFVNDPFTSHQPEMLFQVARFIINSLGSAEVIPYGISKACTLYTLARQTMAVGAFKLARHAYDRLSKLQLPFDRKLDDIEVDMLLVQAKPVRDDPDHLPVCYRCGATNPLLNPFTNKFAKGDVCTNCGHPFVRSFINFDVLPLVEFVPDPTISDEEAVELIRQQPPSSFGPTGRSSEQKSDGWKETKSGGAETLVLDEEDAAAATTESSFGGASTRRKASGKTGSGKHGSSNNADSADNEIYEALGVNNGETDLFTRCLNLTLEKQVYLLLASGHNLPLHTAFVNSFCCWAISEKHVHASEG